MTIFAHREMLRQVKQHLIMSAQGQPGQFKTVREVIDQHIADQRRIDVSLLKLKQLMVKYENDLLHLHHLLVENPAQAAMSSSHIAVWIDTVVAELNEIERIMYQMLQMERRE